MAALAAAAAILGSVAITTGSANAAAGDLPFPGVTLNLTPATTKTSGSTFDMSFTSTATGAGVSAACPGDNPAGWFWTAFIVPAGTDIGAMTFNGSGSPVPATIPSGQTIAQFRPLATPTGTFLRNQTPGLGGGEITPPAGLWLGNNPLPAGQYQVGIACYDSNNVTTNLTGRFYSTPVTIAAAPVVAGTNPQGFIWGNPFIPAAPGLTSPSVTAAAPTVNFTQAPAIPSVAGYTATLTQTLPTAGAAITINPLAGASSIALPALTLGATYTLNMTSANPQGTSAVSNTLTLTPSVVSSSPVVTAPDAFEGVAPTVAWVAPTSPTTPAPATYTVAISGGPSGFTPPAPFTGVTGLSQALPTTLPIGSYTATVTPVYAAGSGVTGVAGSDPFSITPNSLIYQEITVERPAGALVLTQRCGVYGPLDPFTAVDAFPGFPRSLVLAGAVANTPGTPEAPDTNLGAGYTADPNFVSYPEVGTYPTECGLSMGVARLVTSGTLAGQFYTASGRLNQVTVLDTRDVDAGWTAKGDIDDLFQQGSGGPGRQFDGNYLGWAPQVTDDSDPVGGSTYNQTVTQGAPVLPGTGGTGVGASTTLGLRANPTLASAPLGAGLGIATLDARMNLLIPASVDRGVTGLYSATLSLTVA